jgi:drug/metabolite transporter (DMT)-like permease
VSAALLAALAGALLYGSGTVLQALAARRASGPHVLRHPWYVAGLGCDLLGWLASLVALRALPLFTVQALLAGSLVVTVLLARVVLDAPLRRVDGVAVVVVVGALVVLARAAGPESPVRALPDGFTATVLAVLGLLAAVSLACYRLGPGWLFALLAALGASGAAICARAVTLPADAGTGELVRAVAVEPLAWAVAAFGLLMTVAYARALERAGVGATAAVMAVVEVVVPATVGLMVLHDSVRPGWPVAAVVASVLALAACLALAASPATTGTGHVPVGPAAAR